MKLKELMENTNKKMPHLYLDMDGVQADFFGAWAAKNNVGNYKESPILVGKTDDVAKSTMTLWVNPVEDNWTIVATKGDLSCVVGTGTHFKVMPNKKSLSI